MTEFFFLIPVIWVLGNFDILQSSSHSGAQGMADIVVTLKIRLCSVEKNIKGIVHPKMKNSVFLYSS